VNAESLGIPAVPIVTERFHELVTAMAFKKGIPNLRMVYTPHPVTDKSFETASGYIEGRDPVSGRPILEEIVEALTVPVSAEDGSDGFLAREPRQRFLGPDTAGSIGR